MTETEIRNKILEQFQVARQKPNADFEESHFLDFLTYPAHKTNSIKNTFQGTKRYYRFMDMLELEFGICFKVSDLDKYYSVDSLTKKVLERLQKAQGNKIILKQRKERKENYLLDGVLIFLLLLFYSWLGFHWTILLILAVFGRIFYWIYSSRKYERQHIKRMDRKLSGN